LLQLGTSVCSGDAALYQITLTTCHYYTASPVLCTQMRSIVTDRVAYLSETVQYTNGAGNTVEENSRIFSLI